MAPRVRCCNAVRSSLANVASSDSVWITDSVLATAFTRYCHIASPTIPLPLPNNKTPRPYTTKTTKRRFSGHVPGPLEARRRLGKRQMTEQLSMHLSLNGGGPPMPMPAWALPSAPGMRQWQWTAPREATLFSHNGAAPVPATAPATAAALPKSMPSQPPLGIHKWLVELADLVDPSGAVIELPETPRSATAAPFFAKLEAWNEQFSQAAEMDAEIEEQLLAEFHSICSEFQTLLRLAGLTVDEVHEAFDLLWGSLESSSLHEGEKARKDKETKLSVQQVDPASALLSAVIDGVGACHLLQAADYGLDFWRSLFACVAQLPNHERTGSVANKILLATPPAFLARMEDILPSHLCAIYVSGYLTPSTKSKRGVADTLQHLDLNRDGGSDLVHATTELIINHFHHMGDLRNVHARGISATPHSHSHATPCPSSSLAASSTSWLFTLAHIPSLQQETLFQTLQTLSQPQLGLKGTSTLLTHNTADLCELLLAQWASRGYVTHDLQHQFQRLIERAIEPNGSDKKEGDPALAVLALALYRSDHSRPRSVALYKSLLRCLQTLGRGAELVPSVAALVQLSHPQSDSQSKPIALLPVAFLESLAWATDDLDTALQIHELYVHSASRKWSLRQQIAHSPRVPSSVDTLWSVVFWDKYADQLSARLEQGTMTPGQVSFALDLPARLAAPKKRKQMAIAPFAKPKKLKYGKYASTNAKKGLGAPTIALVEKLAMYFALESNISPRCALRGVEECRHLLVERRRWAGDQSTQSISAPTSTASTVSTSPVILRAIFDLVTRDLENAHHGRTTRLRWFVDIVRREHGDLEASASGHALERWRRDAARQRRVQLADEMAAFNKAMQQQQQQQQ